MIEFFAFLISASWLVPNSYFPWLAAWSDGVAIFSFLLLLAALSLKVTGARLTEQCLAVAALCIIMPCGQLLTGKLSYGGDAVLVALYVSLWIAAMLVGSLLTPVKGVLVGIDWLFTGYLLAALFSVGIALSQWSGSGVDFGLYGIDLPSGVRPTANFGQPNLFNTACFTGVCAALFLHQRNKLNIFVFWTAAGLLLSGMVLSQSRTGFVQIAALVLVGLVYHSRAQLKPSKMHLVSVGMVYVVGALMLTRVSAALMLPIQRSLQDQMQTGVRIPYWQAMLDAIRQEPIWGYGWLQVGSAQQRVALNHPALDLYFAHSHNFALDLVLWNGLPVGALIIALLVWWFFARARGCNNALAVWLLVLVVGVFAHGMLEFPLEYAYFVIPVGIAMGAIDSFSSARRPLIEVSRWAVLIGSGLLAVAFVLTAIEYIKVEQNYRTQQLELARIGVDRLVTPVPELILLTQLDALLKVSHIEPGRNMNEGQLDSLRRAALRFGFPLALQRYAQALALNGNAKEGRLQMHLLRSMWGEKAYTQSKKQLSELQRTDYPELSLLELP